MFDLVLVVLGIAILGVTCILNFAIAVQNTRKPCHTLGQYTAQVIRIVNVLISSFTFVLACFVALNH